MCASTATGIFRDHRRFVFLIVASQCRGQRLSSWCNDLASQAEPQLTLLAQQAAACSACAGGQGVEPYEQNTQQSRFSGRSLVPQTGQVIVDSRIMIGSPR